MCRRRRGAKDYHWPIFFYQIDHWKISDANNFTFSDNFINNPDFSCLNDKKWLKFSNKTFLVIFGKCKQICFLFDNLDIFSPEPDWFSTFYLSNTLDFYLSNTLDFLKSMTLPLSLGLLVFNWLIPPPSSSVISLPYPFVIYTKNSTFFFFLGEVKSHSFNKISTKLTVKIIVFPFLLSCTWIFLSILIIYCYYFPLKFLLNMQ